MNHGAAITRNNAPPATGRKRRTSVQSRASMM